MKDLEVYLGTCCAKVDGRPDGDVRGMGQVGATSPGEALDLRLRDPAARRRARSTYRPTSGLGMEFVMDAVAEAFQKIQGIPGWFDLHAFIHLKGHLRGQGIVLRMNDTNLVGSEGRCTYVMC